MAPSLNVDMDKTVLGILTLVLDLPSDLTYKYEKKTTLCNGPCDKCNHGHAKLHTKSALKFG